MDAIDDEPEAVVRAPSKRKRPRKITGMHNPMSDSAAALAQVQSIVA